MNLVVLSLWHYIFLLHVLAFGARYQRSDYKYYAQPTLASDSKR
jgi:hypothetical protein